MSKIDLLHEAIKSNDLEKIKEIITQNPSLAFEIPSYFQCWPHDLYNNCFISCAEQEKDMVEALEFMLNKQPSNEQKEKLINSQNAKGQTALWYAARRNHMDSIRFLLAAGADPLSREVCIPLREATQFGHVEAAKLIIESTVDRKKLFAQTDGMDDALSKAIDNYEWDAVRLLMTYGFPYTKGQTFVNPDITDKQRQKADEIFDQVQQGMCK